MAWPYAAQAQAQDEALSQALEARDRIIQQLIQRVEGLEREVQALREAQGKAAAAAPAAPAAPAPAISQGPIRPAAPPAAATAAPAAPPQPATPPPPAAVSAAPASPPAEEEREVARIPTAVVERGGSLLKPGSFQIESALGYSHAESSNLILTGFSVLPLIILGTLESERLKQDVLSPTLTFRYGFLKDLQGELSVPATYQIQSRIRVSNAASTLVTEGANQFGLGDVQFGLVYQPVYEKGWIPDVTTALRVRTPTGRDQFDIYEDVAKGGPFSSVEDFVRRLNAEGLPLGSGFWGLTGSVSATKAFDPVILFGTVGYGYNFERTATTIQVSGEQAEGGILLRPQVLRAKIQPGDNVFFSLGAAVALTNQVSVNFGFSDRISFKLKQNGQAVAGSSSNSGVFSTGFTLGLTPRVSLDFGGSIGLTPDAPGFGLSLSVATSFSSFKDLWPFRESQ